MDIVLVGIWLLSVALCLVWLSRSDAEGTERAIWALAIVLVPFLGALAYLIVGRRAGGRRAGPSG
ncbi:MAG: PLDc N-terminal domain-containing protein [Anaerolineales bacterium]